MSISEQESQAVLMLMQKRYSDADRLFARVLQQDPERASSMLWLAQSHLQQQKLDSALRLINSAIALVPGSAEMLRTKARILYYKDNLDESKKVIEQALELDPYDSSSLSILAGIFSTRRNHMKALEMADRALEIDPSNVEALNIRSLSLNKLNRSQEVYDTLDVALQQNPDDPYTHTNYGWVCLENREYEKAYSHFTESLAVDPNNEYAQSGLLETIKSTNPIYRLYLRYVLWTSEMSKGERWGLIIIVYVMFRMLRVLNKYNPSLAPVLTPVIYVVAILIYATWIVAPLSNLYLRFNKYGQLLLDEKQKLSSNLVAISLAAGMVGFILFGILSLPSMLAIGVFGLTMMLPLGTMFIPASNKYALTIYTCLLAGLGLLGIIYSIDHEFNDNPFVFLYLLGFVGYQFFANYIIIKEDKYG